MADLLLLGQPGISERLTRALDVKGDTPQESGSTYLPTILAEDLTFPEFAWLRRYSLFGHNADSPAVAAQFSHVVFGSNNPGQRALCFLERILISNTGAAANSFRFGARLKQAGIGISPTGPTAPWPRDDRVAAQATPSLGYSQFSASAFANAGQALTAEWPQVLLGVSQTAIIEVQQVLTGRVTGAGEIHFYVQSGTVNVPFSAAFVWREREMMSSEL